MSMRWFATIGAHALLFAVPCGAQTVYKCVGPNGVVTFSQNKCGNDASLVMDGKKSAKVGADVEGSQPSATSPTEKADANIQAISDSVEDSNCQRDAQRLFIVPSQARIEQANRQIAELKSRVYANGYGQTHVGNAAIANQQVEQEIISLNQVISSEQARNDSILAESRRRVSDAITECNKRKQEREDRRQSASRGRSDTG